MPSAYLTRLDNSSQPSSYTHSLFDQGSSSLFSCHLSSCHLQSCQPPTSECLLRLNLRPSSSRLVSRALAPLLAAVRIIHRPPLESHVLTLAIAAASTSKLRMGNGAANPQQSSSGVQGGARSEPPRPKPSYPAPSTILPDDSISVRGDETASSKQTRPNVDNGNFKRPQYGSAKPSAPKPAVASRNNPQVPQQTAGWEPYDYPAWDYRNQYAPSSFAPGPQPSISGNSQTSSHKPLSSTQKAPSSTASASTQKAPSSTRPIQPGSNERVAPSQRSAPTATSNQNPPSTSRSNAPGNVRSTTAPSTARVTNRQPSEVPQSVISKAASASQGGTSTGSSRQNRAMEYSGGLPQQPVVPQLPQGISIGVPPATQMHFHYNQVDNRQLHISNVSRSLLTFLHFVPGD